MLSYSRYSSTTLQISELPHDAGLRDGIEMLVVVGDQNGDVLLSVVDALEPAQLRHHGGYILLHPRCRLSLHLKDIVHDPGGVDAVKNVASGLQPDEDHLRVRAVSGRLDQHD